VRRERREGPACTWPGLYEDKLEDIQRTCGKALQDQGTKVPRYEYEGAQGTIQRNRARQ